jgi:hypothetical protein
MGAGNVYRLNPVEFLPRIIVLSTIHVFLVIVRPWALRVEEILASPILRVDFVQAFCPHLGSLLTVFLLMRGGEPLLSVPCYVWQALNTTGAFLLSRLFLQCVSFWDLRYFSLPTTCLTPATWTFQLSLRFKRVARSNLEGFALISYLRFKQTSLILVHPSFFFERILPLL